MPVTFRAVMMIVPVAAMLAIAGCAGTTETTPAAPPVPAMTTTAPSGLQYADTVPGTGRVPRRGQTAVVHYTGWLYDNGASP